MNNAHDTQISRRRLAIGLALAPLAVASPAIAATHAADDPVIAALADLDRFRTNTLHPIGLRFHPAERAFLSSKPRTKPAGYDEIEKAWGDAVSEEFALMRGVLAAQPATMAGAAAMLAFIGSYSDLNEAQDEIRGACGAVASFLDGRGMKA